MGVAFVVNKRSMRWKEIRTTEIVPGRAILLEIPWYDDKKLTCLNTYAPNDQNENGRFWNELYEHWRNSHRLSKPTFMLGDMNVVEDAVDRLPAHSDLNIATNALTNLKTYLNLIDGWRRQNPTGIEFSFFMANRPIQSRIDRIYIKQNLAQYSWNWNIERTGLNTDHRLVSANIINPRQPMMGEGRYAMPLSLIQEPSLMNKLRDLGSEYEKELNQVINNRSPQKNPQTIHKNFKTKVLEEIRRYSKTLKPKLMKEVAALQRDIQKVLNSHGMDDDMKASQIGILDDRIKEIETRRFMKARDTVAADNLIYGETITKQ